MPRKPKQAKPPTPKVLYTYEDRWICRGEPKDPDDRWSSRSDTIKECKVTYVFPDNTDVSFMGTPYNNSCKILDAKEEILPGTEIFLVEVTYETGDTFGRTLGELEVACGYLSMQEAYKCKERILKNDIGFLNKMDIYASWTGYFERLTAVNVNLYAVRKTN